MLATVVQEDVAISDTKAAAANNRKDLLFILSSP
jgi:hypothetical protein